MSKNLEFTNATEALIPLLREVLENGTEVNSRNGRTRELLHAQVTLTNPFPFEITTPGRNGSIPAQIAETMWILAGRNDIEWLRRYLPRAADFSDDGVTWRGGYGPRIRKWGEQNIDQLRWAFNALSDDKDTRRAVIQIYSPDLDSPQVTPTTKDVPCNNWLTFLIRDGKLHAHVAIRSNDLMWGWSGINHFEWAAIQHILAGLLRVEQGNLTFSISSLHLYQNHWAKARRIQDQPPVQGTLEGVKFDASAASHNISGLDLLVRGWFRIEEKIHTNDRSGQVEYEISRFPERMFRDWLWALYEFKHNIPSGASRIAGTSLRQALSNSPHPVEKPGADVSKERLGEFVKFVQNLHQSKDAVYGDSWARRGELLGILANCARKVDRLGVAGGGDTAADTAIDLLVYLLKYKRWLVSAEEHLPLNGAEHVVLVNSALVVIASDPKWWPEGVDRIPDIRTRFDKLEELAIESSSLRLIRVQELIVMVFPLAFRLWDAEEQNAASAAAKVDNDTRRWDPELDGDLEEIEGDDDDWS